MKRERFLLIKGIANYKAVRSALTEMGHEIQEEDFDPEKLSSAVAATRPSAVFAFFISAPLLRAAASFPCPLIVWLSDKTTVKNIDAAGADLSRCFVFSLDPADVDEFNRRGFRASLLPCNSGLDGAPLPDVTPEDERRFSCDVSFVGQSMTVLHNPYFQFLSQVSNMLKHLGTVIDAQTADFTRNRVAEDYAGPGSGNYSIQYMMDVLHAIHLRDLDFIAGVEASSRLRKKLVTALDGMDVKVFGDEYWRTERKGTIQIFPETSYRTETPKVYLLSKINLNVSKTFFSGTIQRVYDIAFCGGFCLTDHRDDVARNFEIGKELETYRTEREMVEKARHYLAHDEERRTVAEAGRRRVLRDHRAAHRVARALAEAGLAPRKKEG